MYEHETKVSQIEFEEIDIYGKILHDLRRIYLRADLVRAWDYSYALYANIYEPLYM